MMWGNLLIAGIIGVIIGFFFGQAIKRSDKSKKQLKTELSRSQFELEQYKQELTDHLAKSEILLENISKDYAKLYEHMAKTSSELVPHLPRQDNPFQKTWQTQVGPAEIVFKNDIDQAPRDYADKTSHLFKNPT